MHTRLTEFANSFSSPTAPRTTPAEVIARCHSRAAATSGRSCPVCELCVAGYTRAPPGHRWLRHPASRIPRVSLRSAFRRAICHVQLFLQIFFCHHEDQDLRQICAPRDLTTRQSAAKLSICFGVRALNSDSRTTGALTQQLFYAGAYARNVIYTTLKMPIRKPDSCAMVHHDSARHDDVIPWSTIRPWRANLASSAI